MKHTSFLRNVCGFFALVCGLISTSCSATGYVDMPTGEALEVGICLGGTATRTEMQDNGLSASWVAGDHISVWAKNSSESYTLSKQKFSLYGSDAQSGFFTSTLSSPMEDGTYTYYCTYPVPQTVSGTKATFRISGTQDGKASDGVDVMIATPANGEPLSAMSSENPSSRVSLTMNRMMHQFRFWFEGASASTEKITRIIMTMPDYIVGNVTFDYVDPSANLSVSNGTKELTLVLDESLNPVADISQANFACASVIPFNYTCDSNDYMNLTVYTEDSKYVLDPISLNGRTFVSGHSTPVRISLTEPQQYNMITIKTGVNNIGEILRNIQIVVNGTIMYNCSNTTGTYHNLVHEQELLGDAGQSVFDSIIAAVNNGTATYRFETNNTLVERKLTTDMMQVDENKVVFELGDVPYLLYEDFSSALASEHNDAYDGTAIFDASRRSVKANLLTGFIPQWGWSATRYKILPGDCVRINCLYESGLGAYKRYCGRLDTPALSYIKSGNNVPVVVEYEMVMTFPSSYNADEISSFGRFKVGYHTNSGAVDGASSDKVNSVCTVVYTSPNQDPSSPANMKQMSHTISSAGATTRIVFWADTSCEKGFFAANAFFYLYLDNIKVYIKSN